MPEGCSSNKIKIFIFPWPDGRYEIFVKYRTEKQPALILGGDTAGRYNIDKYNIVKHNKSTFHVIL